MTMHTANPAKASKLAHVSSGSLRLSTTGFGILVRFVLRRNWLRMLVWLVVLAGMIVLVIDSQRELFPTQAARDAYAQVANTPAIAALTGLPYAAGTLGGILNIKLWMSIAVALSFAVIFQVTRNGRAEEDAGRTELLRAGVLGRHAYSLANWAVATGFAVAVGFACAGAAVSQGLPTGGAVVMGASFAATALVFLGVAAVAGQVTTTSGGATALSSTVLGISYLIRAVADVQAQGDKASWITWLSPIGWAQQSRSYGENLWWPLLVCLSAAIVLGGVALALERGRDLGAGLIPERVGPRNASAFLRTQFGLTMRLQRGSIIGWTLGITVFALFFGGVATAMADLLSGNNPIAQAFLGGSKDVVEGLLGFFLMANALLVAAFVLQSVGSIRGEESSGRTEMQWSLPPSRIRWAAARMIVPAVVSLILLVLSGAAIGVTFGSAIGEPGQWWRCAWASVAYWPSMLVVIGVAVLCAAVIPRAVTATMWTLYGITVALSMLGDLFRLPDWFVKNTPFTVIPRLGMEFTVVPLLVIAVLAVISGGVGLWALRRRDMTIA